MGLAQGKAGDGVTLTGHAWREWALMLASLPLFGLGYVAGVTVRCALWTTAALVEGYKAGMGE